MRIHKDLPHRFLGSFLKFKGQSLRYLSPIFLEAKFGALTRTSEANFGGQAPRPPDMEVPPGYFLAALIVKTVEICILTNTKSSVRSQKEGFIFRMGLKYKEK